MTNTEAIINFMYFGHNYPHNFIAKVWAGKETLTDTSLNNNTIVDEFSILDEEEKKKYNTCSICFDDFIDNSIIRKIKCSHIFHKHCIDPWLLNQSYKCPVCRDSVLHIKDPEI